MHASMDACMHVRACNASIHASFAIADTGAAAFGGTVAKPLHDSALGGGGVGGGARGKGVDGGCGGPRRPREGAAGVGLRHDGGRDQYS